MKSVAYMLDKNIWGDFVNQSCAEYAVGGSGIEMFINSYSELHNVVYKTEAKSLKGYEISNNGGGNWYYRGRFIDENDSLYVISDSTAAKAMWIASPSNDHGNDVMVVEKDGFIRDLEYNNTANGFRPLVCLNSNVYLNWNDQDEIYEIQ